MHPVLFGSIAAYPLFLVLAVVVGAASALCSARRCGINVWRFLPVLLWATAGALLGSKLHSWIERGGVVSPLASEVFGGYRFPGGVVGCLAALYLGSSPARTAPRFALLADALAPAFGFGIATAKGGCLLRGCCFGTITPVVWAISFPKGSDAWNAHAWNRLIPSDAPWSLPVHPLQIYFGLFALALGCLTWWLQPRKRYDGEVMLVYLALQGLGTAFLEFYRELALAHVQLSSLAIGLVATGIWGRKAWGLRRPRRAVGSAGSGA